MIRRGFRLGALREVSLLFPLALLLLVVLSTFTLLAFRSGVAALAEAQPAAPGSVLGAELARQAALARRLTWIVLPVNVLLVALVLASLRQLLAPYEALVAKARTVVPPGQEEDVEVLGATFDRAIAALTRAGRADRERLATTLAQLGELAAGFAHELRNGLATLTGYLSLLEREPPPGEAAGYLKEIRRESDHLTRVLADFLAFARPERLRLESLDPSALLERAARDPALGDVAVEVAAAPASLPPIAGDAHLLERALRNLLDNAARAHREAGASGPIEVISRATPEGLEIAIADRGPGLPEGPVERLFDPFVSGRAGGVGLGLPLAQRIVALHGGTLRLEGRRDGPGTRAVLALPFDAIDTKGN
jgi:signal transduction histidine kinase